MYVLSARGGSGGHSKSFSSGVGFPGGYGWNFESDNSNGILLHGGDILVLMIGNKGNSGVDGGGGGQNTTYTSHTQKIYLHTRVATATPTAPDGLFISRISFSLPPNIRHMDKTSVRKKKIPSPIIFFSSSFFLSLA
jgi:hypothetical protein